MKLRAVVIALVAALLFAAAPSAGAQGSEYADKSLELRTTRTAAVTAGDTAWVFLQWRGLADVDNFRLTATASGGATVGYPENTRDHTSLSRGEALRKDQTDTMALRLTVPSNAREVTLSVSFTWSAFGTDRRASTQIRVPVVRYTGADYEIVDRAVRAGDDGDLWVEITYRGLAPSLQDFRVTVPDAEGLDLYFPRRDHSSLSADAELEDRETDFVRFRINAKEAERLAGLAFVTEYRVGDEIRTDKGALDFVAGLVDLVDIVESGS